jgi:hypothetical protein
LSSISGVESVVLSTTVVTVPIGTVERDPAESAHYRIVRVTDVVWTVVPLVPLITIVEVDEVSLPPPLPQPVTAAEPRIKSAKDDMPNLRTDLGFLLRRRSPAKITERDNPAGRPRSGLEALWY